MTKNINKKSTSGKIQVSLLCLMCIAILVVSFMAFMKLENNLHAFLVFACGCVMDVIIFASGIGQIKR